MTNENTENEVTQDAVEETANEATHLPIVYTGFNRHHKSISLDIEMQVLDLLKEQNGKQIVAQGTRIQYGHIYNTLTLKYNDGRTMDITITTPEKS